MAGKTFSVVAAGLIGGLGVVPALAQEAVYRRVASNELFDGYVKDGERIETKAHVRRDERGVFLNVNRASARAPFRLEFVAADPAACARLASECKAATRFHGGCEVTLRGAPSRADGKRVLFVDRVVAIEPGRWAWAENEESETGVVACPALCSLSLPPSRSLQPLPGSALFSAQERENGVLP